METHIHSHPHTSVCGSFFFPRPYIFVEQLVKRVGDLSRHLREGDDPLTAPAILHLAREPAANVEHPHVEARPHAQIEQPPRIAQRPREGPLLLAARSHVEAHAHNREVEGFGALQQGPPRLLRGAEFARHWADGVCVVGLDAQQEAG